MDIKEYRRKYYQEYYKDPVKKKMRDERNKKYYADPANKKKEKERRKKYFSDPENKARKAAYDKKYHTERRKKDKMFRLRYQVYGYFKNLLKRDSKTSKGYEILNKLGYSLDDLRDRLKSTIPDGYKWEDYLNGNLQIDHIKPISKYNFTSVDDEEFKECWSLKNLQLLTVAGNREKGNKYKV